MRIESSINPQSRISLSEILDLIQDDLTRVEDELKIHRNSSIGPVSEIAGYLLDAGGKRLRPALHLLAAHFCGHTGLSAVRLGAVLELIHNATLLHDDIIDGADTRRGRISSNRRWGNSMTVLAGDWLYMQAFRVALAEQNFRILEILIALTQQMVEGELIQLTWLGRADINEENALDVARRKTACLFEACLQLGAILGRRPPEEEAQLATYGLNLGLAFQVIDDLLDFTGSEEALGKPVVSDLREGKVTLPLVLALRNADGGAKKDVEDVLREGDFISVTPDRIVQLVRETGAVARSREYAVTLADRARRALSVFPDSSYKRALEAVPEFILDRDR